LFPSSVSEGNLRLTKRYSIRKGNRPLSKKRGIKDYEGLTRKGKRREKTSTFKRRSRQKLMENQKTRRRRLTKLSEKEEAEVVCSGLRGGPLMVSRAEKTEPSKQKKERTLTA